MSQQQQLIRTDFEVLPESSVDTELSAKVSRVLAGAQAVIIEDYDKGAITDPQSYIKPASAASVPVVVDPKNKPLGSYAGADIVKPNLAEFLASCGDLSNPVANDDELIANAQKVIVQQHFGALVVTRGGDGMTVVTSNEVQHIPARLTDVFDVTGAGDTAVAVLGVSCAVGRSAVEGAKLANIAAGIAVAKSGTATVSGPELVQSLIMDARTDTGVMNEEQLVAAVARAKNAGETIVFTNGCFDILHAGHVAYLEEAKALGERLIVALNDDLSVRKLKGESRPVNTLKHRQVVLAGLASVDWVTSFSADTPCDLLTLLKPHVLVKGGDYSASEVVGSELVGKYGGTVKVLQLVEDVSTSAIVDTILKG